MSVCELSEVQLKDLYRGTLPYQLFPSGTGQEAWLLLQAKLCTRSQGSFIASVGTILYEYTSILWAGFEDGRSGIGDLVSASLGRIAAIHNDILIYLTHMLLHSILGRAIAFHCDFTGDLLRATMVVAQATPKLASQDLFRIQSYLSTVLWTLLVRSWWLGGSRSRQRAWSWLKGLSAEHQWIFTRSPSAHLDSAKAEAAISFATLQLRSISGPLDLGRTAIYGIFSGKNSYSGRTALQRQASRLWGSWQRYGEHCRAIWREALSSEKPKSRRSRYKKLLFGTKGVSLAFVCLQIVADDVAQLHETWCIQQCLPNSNNLLWTPGIRSRLQTESHTDGHQKCSRLRAPPWQRMRKIRNRLEPAALEAEAFDIHLKNFVGRRLGQHAVREQKLAGHRKLSLVSFSKSYDEHPQRHLGPVPVWLFPEISILALTARYQSDSIWPIYFTGRRFSADTLFRLHDLTNAMAKPSAKSKARSCLLRTARHWNLPLGKTPCLRLPHDRWMKFARAWVRKL